MAFFFSTNVSAQSFYVLEENGIISRITFKGAGYTKQVIEGTCQQGAEAIAVYKNDIYYFDFELKKATIDGNKLTNCTVLGKFIGAISLTVDKDGMLYTASGKEIYKIDPVAKTQVKLGTMPYTCAGDLMFYKGQLYMASYEGIVKVNINDPAQSLLVTNELTSCWGLASVPYSSTKNKTYVFGGTSIYEIDLDNNKSLGLVMSTDFTIYDAASDVEDGSLAPININEIRQYAECPYNGKGTIEVICNNALVDYTYELNGIINTTGVFGGLDPGTFRIKVRSDSEVKEEIITVAKFPIIKPKIEINRFDDLCVAPGAVTTSVAENPALFSIRYNSVVYPINNLYKELKAGLHRFIVLNKAGCEIDTIDVTLSKCEIKLEGYDVTQNCDLVFKGDVRIKTKAHINPYTFKLGTVSNQTGIFTGLGKGPYKVTISSAEDVKEVDVMVPDYAALIPVISNKIKNAICEEKGSVRFDMSTDAVGYTIKLGGTTYPFAHEFKLVAGTYVFSVFKPDGCILNSYTATLTLEGCEELFFPNTFTPNNDGVNDVFLPYPGGKAVNFKWKIFNRYGAPIFTSDNTQNGWSGEHNGKPTGAGVYYWVATYINKQGRPVTKSGNVALIR